MHSWHGLGHGIGFPRNRLSATRGPRARRLAEPLARLEAAVDDQVTLPPVELVRAGGEYWVVDGHNRVALAKEHGQLWIDADITELDIPEPATTETRVGPDKVAAKAA
jgi:hypothetical protein